MEKATQLTCTRRRDEEPDFWYFNEFIVQIADGSNADDIASELGLENMGLFPGFFTDDSTYKFKGGSEEKRELLHSSIKYW